MTSLTLGLVGNPNCGKSTLFNALTGSRQKVGNWPGVTVECKTGAFDIAENLIEVVDLPGIYQVSYSESLQAIDERIACDFILNHHADIIVNIVDAAHLERHLYLTLQLLAMKVPLILAVNMMDVAQRRKIEIDLFKLQEKLGCPVIGLVANKAIGIKELKKNILIYKNKIPVSTANINYPIPLQEALNKLSIRIQDQHPEFKFCASWIAQQLLQNNTFPGIDAVIQAEAATLKIEVEKILEEDLDIIFADILYTSAHQIVKSVQVQKENQKTFTQKLDKIILNRFLGIPIFLAIMYCMFLFAINLGGAFQDFFDIGSDAIFVQGTTQLLSYFHTSNWIIALLAAGFGRGINTTISFIPVIGAMFLFLAFLEASGYMARASFVIDRFMRVIGLPGKSFVPMIVGFGCNVPAILAARTLENPRDRILTILMSPFMSCGARLAIFAVFTAAFFPSGGQNIVFALYLIGIVAAVLTGLILRKTLLKGELTPLILELPAYHLPSFSTLLMQTWLRLKSFIFRAGKLIVPICMLIGVMNAINTDGSLNTDNSSRSSILSAVGRTVTPFFAPMGITENNWPATVGLVTGVLAKEVVVATLNTLYSQEGNIASDSQEPINVLNGIKAAFHSVPTNLIALKNSFANPIVASAPEHTLSHHVYGIMYERFAGQAAALAYLLFVLLYFPCISATAVMTKELNKKWTFFSVVWSTGLAYAVASTFYQLATFNSHPKQSFIWIVALITAFGYILSIMRKYSHQEKSQVKLCC